MAVLVTDIARTLKKKNVNTMKSTPTENLFLFVCLKWNTIYNICTMYTFVYTTILAYTRGTHIQSTKHRKILLYIFPYLYTKNI